MWLALIFPVIEIIVNMAPFNNINVFHKAYIDLLISSLHRSIIWFVISFIIFYKANDRVMQRGRLNALIC